MEAHYVAEAWTPSTFDTYRSAVLYEGNQTLSVVTKHLYKGGNTSPDVYFKSKFGEEKYKNTFNRSERLKLENNYEFFNIKHAVENYDISLNFLVQEYLCGLAPKGARHWQMQGTFENMLNQVHKKRNYVSHNDRHMYEYQLKEELLNLQELYCDILNYVYQKTYCSIDSDRLRIMNSLKEKFPDEDNVQQSSFSSNSRFSGRSNSNLSCRQGKGEESDLPTYGKIALGIAGAAVAAWGASKIVENVNISDQEKRRKQKSSNETDCSIM